MLPGVIVGYSVSCALYSFFIEVVILFDCWVLCFISPFVSLVLTALGS